LVLKFFLLFLFSFIFSNCAGKNIIENSNRIKNISNISKSGVKEELENKTKKILRDMR
jgi:hypothetical protein